MLLPSTLKYSDLELWAAYLTAYIAPKKHPMNVDDCFEPPVDGSYNKIL